MNVQAFFTVIKNKKLLVKYIFSYLLIFLLPVLFLGWLLNAYVLERYTEDILEKNTQLPNLMQTNMDMQIQQLLNYVVQTGLNPAFSNEHISANPAAFFAINSNLRQFLMLNTFISQVFYWQVEADIVYSPDGTYQPDILFDRIYVYENMSEYQIRNMIRGITLPAWWPVQRVDLFTGGSNEFITLICPVEFREDQKRVLIYLIEKNTIEHLIGNISNSSNMNNIIAAGDNAIYSSLQYPDFGEVINYTTGQNTLSGENSWNRFRFNNEDMFIYKLISNHHPLFYYSIIPANNMLAEILSLQRSFNLVMFWVILFFSALASFLTYSNYKPISKLAGMIKIQRMDPLLYSNELDAVHLYLNELSDDNTSYSRDQFYLRLLIGSEPISGEDRAEVKSLLPGPYYRVLYLRVMEPGEQEKLKQRVQRIFSGRLYSYVVEFLDKNTFAIVCSAESPGEKEFAAELKMIMAEMEKDDILAEAAIGGAVDSIDTLKGSLIQAKIVYAAGGNQKHGIVIGRKDGNVLDHSNWYITQELEALGKAIEEKKPNLIDFTATVLISQIQAYAGEPFIANCICYDVINKIMNANSAAGSEHRFEDFKYISNNMNYESLDDLVQVIQTLCRRIIEDITEPKKQAAPAINDMIEYIDNHFCDPNFSIKWLSYEFGISPSNFSHQFKSRKGLSLMDYINQLKINYAKQLLESSDFSVAQISEKLGYNHPSSFIRTFKKITGSTPGETAEKLKNNQLKP